MSHNLRAWLQKLRFSLTADSHFHSGSNGLALSNEFELCQPPDEASIPAFPPALSGDFNGTHVSPLMDTIKEGNDADVKDFRDGLACPGVTHTLNEYSGVNEDIWSVDGSSKLSSTVDDTVEDSSEYIVPTTGDASSEKLNNDHNLSGNMGNMEYYPRGSAAVPVEAPKMCETKEKSEIEAESSITHPAGTAEGAKESPV